MRLILVALLIMSYGFLFSQNTKSYTCSRITQEPVIDGVLDEEVWKTGNWEGDFVQRQPIDNSKPSQETYFKLYYTDNFIYVAIKSMDTQADSIDSRLVRRDKQEGDMVAVHFDSYNDSRTSFSFFVNAAGVKSDVLFSNGGSNEDPNWNPIWWVKTTKDANGWYAEMKIPLSQLRFSKTGNKVWGFEVSRYIFRLQELSLWQPIPQTASGWVFNFGKLYGISDIKPKRIIELAPYVSGGFESFEKEEGNPYADGSNFIHGIGVDGKVGLTNDFILDFTINPDFGQVEADPSQVNLTAFEVYFEEQRPFFVEGGNILDFKITPGNHDAARDNLFYSRRVGRIPQYYPDLRDDEYIDFPIATSILGAMKISGKTKEGFSLGVMESLTKEQKAPIYYQGNEREQIVEPLTNYFVARAQQDINQGNTIIGGAITSTNRFYEDSALTFLPKAAVSSGLDFTQYWDERKYYFKVDGVYSHVSGDSLSLIERQTAPQRYFQRPDADYINLDSSITSLSGYGGNISAGRQVSGGLSYSVNASLRSPGISIEDLGYLRKSDYIMQSAEISYRFTTPKYFYRNIDIGVVQWNGWDYGGRGNFNGGMAWFTMQFRNYYTFVLRSSGETNIHDNFKLRGGPSFFEPGNVSMRANIETNQSKKFYMDFGFRQAWGQYAYSRTNAWDAGFTYRPIDALELAFHPNVKFKRNDLQYVDELSMNKDARYILATIDQTTLVFRFYVNINLSPNLTIQYFGSPFISTGKYTNFKRVTNSNTANYSDRTHQFTENEISYNATDDAYDVDENGDGNTDYSIYNPDFNFKQFQSNLVLRWEFTPGSALFLVWSQNKTNENGFGTFNFSDDMSRLFSTIPHNVFLVKFSYRFFNK
jgi:hypothetical protein